jgi:hypothetical protein
MDQLLDHALLVIYDMAESIGIVKKFQRRL